MITGDDRAFAAGADITEMSGKTAVDMISEDYFAGWDAFTALRTPKIAAVAGYALGGGCELAMMCDTIYAATTATFGQPEITLGVIPGIGGTQRLTGLVGKAKAMDLILTGRPMNADEAERCGLVARTFAPETLLTEVQAIAASIAGYGRLAVRAAREAVERALETSLQRGSALRAAQLPRVVRHQRPERGDERLPGEARAALHRAVRRVRVGVARCGAAVPDGRRTRVHYGSRRDHGPVNVLASRPVEQP